MRYEEYTIEGRNAVIEAFRSGKTIDKLFVLDGCQDGPVKTIVREAKKGDTIINFVTKERLDEMSRTGHHQGVIAKAAAYEYAEVSDILAAAKEKGEPPFILLLDGIEDPHNLGAIIRTANLAGAHGVIIPKRRAVGSIIESSLDKGRGYVSTVLVENGTLKVGDIVLAGTHFGRVKAMFNERNQRIEKAGPSEPALILGLNGAPQAGDTFNVLETDQEAREIANRREQLQRELGLRTQKMLTLDDIGRRIAVGNFQELNVIVKGDVDGSVEALSDSLIRLSTEEIQVNVIHKAVGQISESDVVLAAASNAIIIGFQVRPALPARRLAEKEGVEIRLYSIIYDAIEEVKSAMEGMLSPEIKEEITANVEVQQVFKITKVGTIAGCMVREGKIKRSNKVRVIRDGIVVHSGELGSLKRFKDDVKEVVAGLDCGLNLVNYNDIQVGDIIEAYEETEIKKTL